MKCVIFDASPVISLAMNNLLPVVPELKKHFGGDFIVTEGVKEELVDSPLNTKKFKFQALQIMRLVDNKTFSLIPREKIEKLSQDLLELTNNIFVAKDNPIRIVHKGEMESLAAAITLGASAIVVDERTTRKLVEEPHALQEILEKKLHTKVEVNSKNLSRFKKMTKDIKVLRSFELVIISYELGILDEYLPKTADAKRILLEAVLWGLKLDGCAVSQEEIEGMIVSETRR